MIQTTNWTKRKATNVRILMNTTQSTEMMNLEQMQIDLQQASRHSPFYLFIFIPCIAVMNYALKGLASWSKPLHWLLTLGVHAQRGLLYFVGVRECVVMKNKKRPVQHHRDGRCLAGTVAWSIPDKGPAESQYH